MKFAVNGITDLILILQDEKPFIEVTFNLLEGGFED